MHVLALVDGSHWVRGPTTVLSFRKKCVSSVLETEAKVRSQSVCQIKEDCIEMVSESVDEYLQRIAVHVAAREFLNQEGFFSPIPRSRSIRSNDE